MSNSDIEHKKNMGNLKKIIDDERGLHERDLFEEN